MGMDLRSFEVSALLRSWFTGELRLAPCCYETGVIGERSPLQMPTPSAMPSHSAKHSPKVVHISWTPNDLVSRDIEGREL